MSNYYRITAHHKTEDIAIILDSNGKFEKLWQFSSFLVNKGFSIIDVCKIENYIDGTFPLTENRSDKLLVRAVQKGMPKVEAMTYQNKPCRTVTVDGKTYGQYTY